MKRKFKGIYSSLLSIMTTLSLTMKFELPDYTNINLAVSREFIINLEQSLTVDSFKSTILCVLILLSSVKIEHASEGKIRISSHKIFYILCITIGFVWLMASSYMINNSLINIYATNGQIIKSIIYFIGTVNLLILFGKLIFVLADHAEGVFLFCQYSDDDIRKSGYKSFIFLMIMWLPHLIMAYPASLISDAWSQLSMFYGRKTFTAHHPPFHTWTIGMAVKMGEKVGSANIGLFLFILVQSIIFAVIISYGIMTMKRLNTPRWLLALTKLIAVTSPYYTAYIGLITKDTLYSYFFLLFIIELIYFTIIPGGVLGK